MLNFYMRGLERRLNPTCARRQADKHTRGKGHSNPLDRRGCQAPSPKRQLAGREGGAAGPSRGGSGVAVKQEAERGGWRVQDSLQVRRQTGGSDRLGAPRAPGGERNERSGSSTPRLRDAAVEGGQSPCPAVRGGASSERGGGRSASPAGRGAAVPQPFPPLLFFPLSTRASPISSQWQPRALLGAGRGEGAAGASAGSALLSAATAAAAAGSQAGGGCAARSPPRRASPPGAHLLDGRHRVPALGHPGGEVGGGR